MKDGKVLFDSDTIYQEYGYKNEKDLEDLVIKKKIELFGKDVIYINSKKIISSTAKISKIPDGLFIKGYSRENARLWLVEYELASHDLDRHVIPQILGFVKALQNESTKKAIKERMYEEILQNKESKKIIRSILPEGTEIYPFLESVLDRQLGIVIVIDRKTAELEEVVESISMASNIQTKTLEFMTYEDDAGNKVHLADPLVSEYRLDTAEENKNWEDRLSKSSPIVKRVVKELVSMARKEFHCVTKPWYEWYALYIEEPSQRRNLFGVLQIGKKSCSLCFRVEPRFKTKNPDVRKVKGFFFPTGTERRITLSEDNTNQIRMLLRHSFKITQEKNKD